jgi:hypothetical protein
MEVRHVERQARNLVSLNPANGWSKKQVEGAIVRVYPPVGTTPATIEAWCDKMHKQGAFAVKRMPCPKGARVMDPATVSVASVATVRQVVEGMVEDANTDDRDLLREVVGAALDAEGL